MAPAMDISVERVETTFNDCNHRGCNRPVDFLYHVMVGGMRIRLCRVHLYVLHDQLVHLFKTRG